MKKPNYFSLKDYYILVLIFSLLTFSQLAKSQCPVPNPTGVGGCSSNTGSAILTASGSLGFYNWYANSTGGQVIASGNSFTTPNISSATTYYLSAYDTNAALSFDGVDDYVAINYSYTSASVLSEFTVEAWVNTSFVGASAFDNWSIIDFDRSEYFNFFVSADDGEVGFSTASGGVDDFYTSGSPVNDGTWHHIVGVYDGTDKIIYVDGVEVARKLNPHSGANIGTGSTRFGFLGEGSEATSYNSTRNNFYYDGKIDEVRLWHTARTPSEILLYKDSCLTGSETDLIIYYNMNEYQGTTLNDLTGGGSDGAMINFSTSSGWVNGVVNNCDCESARIPVLASISGGNLSDIKLSCGTNLLDAGAGFTSYLWNTGETSQTISPSAYGFYSVTTTGGCSGTDTASVVGYSGAENSLSFDGTNDYTAINNMVYDGTNYTELTVETWLKTTNSGNQIIASFDRSDYWRLEINGDGAGAGQIGFDINTSSGILDFGSVSRVDDGEWHHVAATFDNGTVSIYIDGNLDAMTTTGPLFGSSSLRYGFLGVGSESGTYNGTTGPASYFHGEMDEFRVWNKAKTITEIRDEMSKHIAGNSAGLELYYKFDVLSGNNVSDYSTEIKQNCVLQNFSSSPLSTSGAFIGDEVAYLFSNSWSGQNVFLNTCGGQNFNVSNVSGSPSGVMVYYIHNVPNSIIGIAGLGSNDSYFGVHKFNDASSTYTATYNYSNNPHVSNMNEPTLALFKRADNSSTTWVDALATLDISNTNLVATAQGTEFILGSIGIPLPIELLSFTANVNNNNVDLKWITITEINNDYFIIERSSNGIDWEHILNLDGAGNSNQIIEYFEIDYKPFEGLSYYRIKQTDNNGEFSYSNIVPVRFENNDNRIINLFPNPIGKGETLNIELKNIKGTEYLLTLRDIQGKEYYSKVILKIDGNNLIGLPINNNIPKGIYLITASSKNLIYSKKILIR